MSICDKCVKRDVCCDEGKDEEALTYCASRLEERPHGKWIFKNDNPLIPTGYWECSECKKGRLMVEENYCPNCGASMRTKGGDST